MLVVKRKCIFHLTLIIFTLFQKNSDTEEILEKLKQKDDESSNLKRISCPHCKWQPKDSSTWYCCNCDFPEFFYNGCGTAWNTFNTKGKCPGCQHQWRWTSCLSCGKWSLHKDWYRNDS